MSNVITARIDDQTRESLDRLAAELDRSRAWLVAEAVKRFVAQEIEFSDFLAAGEEDFVRGDFLTHEEFMAELRARHSKAAA